MAGEELKPEIILGYETEIKHLVNDLRLTTEEYESSRRKYFEIYSKLFQANEQLQMEIKEKMQAREELAIRLEYETGIANFSQALLLAKENTIDKALPFLLEASRLSRVYLFENFIDPIDGLCTRRTHEVCAKGVERLAEKGRNVEHIVYAKGLKFFADELGMRKPVLGTIDDFKESEQKVLRKYSIVSIVIIPIFINDNWFGLICFDDVYEKRQWNDADIRMLETAGEIVGAFLERTIAEEKLRYAKKLAEEASRLKSQLVFNVSHEIRTPLNCIIGFAEAIQHSESLSEIKQNAKLVLQQSELLLMLIGDLLDHAKIEAGKMLIENRPFNLMNILNRMSNSLGSLAQGKGIQFLVDIDENVPRNLLGDELRLLQVLMNLGGNSVKFTEKGSVSIHVEEAETKMPDADITLLFSIIDTGIGIPKEKQEDIFKSFTQVDGSITRKYGGTGLGTTIARQLVELMGGVCGLESEPGKGSRFWFTIPFKIATKVVEEMDADIVMTDMAKPALKTARILVAEDYLPNMQVVLQHLANTGYKVDAVQNGLQAVEACKNNEYDLILLDVQMPEMDGYQAAREIRSGNSRSRQKPIIAITAHADSTSRQNCLKSGMNDILIKPIRRDTFLPFVESWVTGKERNKLDVGTPENQVSVLKHRAIAPLNYKKAIYEFGGNKDTLDMVLKEFLNSLDEQLLVLRNARENCDSEKFRTEAHRIRGGAANLTAARLAACAESLENCAIQGQLDKADNFLLDFESEVQILKKFISTEKIIL